MVEADADIVGAVEHLVDASDARQRARLPGVTCGSSESSGADAAGIADDAASSLAAALRTAPPHVFAAFVSTTSPKSAAKAASSAATSSALATLAMIATPCSAITRGSASAICSASTVMAAANKLGNDADGTEVKASARGDGGDGAKPAKKKLGAKAR